MTARAGSGLNSSRLKRAAPWEQTRMSSVSAIRLCAEHGIASVSVRDILKGAGQQNGASLHYHFRSKSDLLRKLVDDEKEALDQRRNHMLDALETNGGPTGLRQLIEILVRSMIPARDGSNLHQARFVVAVRAQHPELLDATESSSLRRTAIHIGRLAPDHTPAEVRRRLAHVSIYLETALAAREIALEGGAGRSLWRSPFVIENLIDSALGLISSGMQDARHTDRRRTGNPSALREDC